MIFLFSYYHLIWKNYLETKLKVGGLLWIYLRGSKGSKLTKTTQNNQNSDIFVS